MRINETVAITKITLNQQPEILALMKTIYQPAYAYLWEDKGKGYVNRIYSNQQMKRDLDDVNSQFYLVSHHKKTVGIFKLLLPSTFPENEFLNIAKLDRIYLHHSVHGKGIAKQLMLWALEQMKNNRFEYCWLEAMVSQPRAIAFYEKFDFTYHSQYDLPFEGLHNELRAIQRMVKKL